MKSAEPIYVGGVGNLITFFFLLVSLNITLWILGLILKARKESSESLKIISVKARFITIFYLIISVSVFLSDIITH